MNALLLPPCPPHAPRSRPRAACGSARLEFALAVVVLAVIAALALQRIAALQVAAHSAGSDTAAAQQRSMAALAQACVTHPASAPLAGVAPAASSPSCP